MRCDAVCDAVSPVAPARFLRFLSRVRSDVAENAVVLVVHTSMSCIALLFMVWFGFVVQKCWCKMLV